jgi:hypothetical protein
VSKLKTGIWVKETFAEIPWKHLDEFECGTGIRWYWGIRVKLY